LALAREGGLQIVEGFAGREGHECLPDDVGGPA
jgi:hypothetical protein